MSDPPAGPIARGSARLRRGWAAVLAAPGGRGKVARGIAAGAFAAMLPAFGLHLVLAGGLGLAVRGSLPAAAAACLLLGNPLTHAVLLPAEYGIGRALLPAPRALAWHGAPGWLGAAWPAAEETLLGGLILGLAAAAIAWTLARRALRGRG